MKLILASQSPRRKEILENLGLTFEVIPAKADESSEETDPERLVELLSSRKAQAVAALLQKQGNFSADTLIVACDTVVCCDKKILGKPKNRKNAAEMLRLLSGRSHTVSSGITLLTPERQVTAHETTKVFFDALTEEEIARYVASGESDDKAGAYAIQGLAGRFIRGIEGCYFNVVGLPVHRMCRLAKENGIDLF